MLTMKVRRWFVLSIVLQGVLVERPLLVARVEVYADLAPSGRAAFCGVPPCTLSDRARLRLGEEAAVSRRPGPRCGRRR